MVADCRRANCWFTAPDRVRLCTAEALSRINLEPGAEFCVSTADLKDAFYHFQLPEVLRPYFGMRPIRAGELGIDSIDGEPVSATQWLHPRLKVLPMGWSHALWWCQNIHQRIVSKVGANASNRLEDKAAVPSGSCMHLEYVDNFVVLGTSKTDVERLAGAGVQALRDSGLVVHEVEHSTGSIKVLGWEFNNTTMRPKPSRVWRVILAMRKLLSIGKASGKQLEKIVGHATFIGLGRREVLSIFGETYTFIQRHYHYSKRLWGSVRRELQIFCGIAPLIWRDLSLPWCQQVTAIDASTWGMGATVAEFPLNEVVELGRFSERWRFESEALSKLRSTAFGADVAVGSEEADANLWATTTSQACSGIKPIQVVDQKSEEEVFKQLPFSTVDRAWKVVGRSRWRRVEAIPVLEARASLYAVKHALRSQGAFGKRHLVLSDSISAICALDRGRGKAFRMRRVSQQVCALTLATNTAFCYRWLPSEWNPADGPSRGSYFPSRGVQFPAREKDPSGHDSPAPEFEPWGQAKTPESELFKQAKSDTSQSCSQGGACREEETAGRTTGGSGVTETGLGGKQLPCSISGMLGTVDITLRSEVELQNSSRNSGSEGVGFFGSDVCEWGGLESGSIYGGCNNVHASPSSESKVYLDATDQTIPPRLEETRSTKISIADALGSDVFHGPRGLCYGQTSGSSHDAVLLCTVPETGGGVEVANHGLGASSTTCKPIFMPLERGVAPIGSWSPIQDCRVRRDGELRSAGPRLHTEGNQSIDEGSVSKQSRAPFLSNRQSTEKRHGSHSIQTRSAADRSSSSVQTSSWRSQSRLCSAASISGGNTKERKVEVIQQRQTIRKRRPNRSNVEFTAQTTFRSNPAGRQKYSTNRPEPALKPGRAWTVPVFLELFSGSGHLSLSISRICGWPVLLWDISLGPEYDLRSPKNRRLVADWIRSGFIIGFHLGTPCESYSRARDVPPGPPPLRSDSSPLGLPNLRPSDLLKVLDGNCFMRFSAYILRLGIRYGVPGSMENPQRSRIWLTPPLLAILRHKFSYWQVTHYCSWGKPFKKPTAFLSVLIRLQRLETAVCKSTKRGVCQYSSKAHVQLCGQDAQGNWLTKLAQPYPRQMCDAIAKDYKDFEVCRIASKFEKYIGRWPTLPAGLLMALWPCTLANMGRFFWFAGVSKVDTSFTINQKFESHSGQKKGSLCPNHCSSWTLLSRTF